MKGEDGNKAEKKQQQKMYLQKNKKNDSNNQKRMLQQNTSKKRMIRGLGYNNLEVKETQELVYIFVLEMTFWKVLMHF